MKRFFQNGGGITDTLPRNISSENLLRLPQGTSSTSTGVTFPISPTSPLPLFSASQSSAHISSSQQYFDMQYQSRTTSPVPPMTPITTTSSTNIYGSGDGVPAENTEKACLTSHSIERSDLYKGLKSLESLLVVFDEYRDLKVKLAKCEKRLAKSLQEMSKSKVIENIPSETLQSSALVFDSMTETSSKHAKQIQKEYECVNEHCGKYFKRIAKEEKNHDELLDTLDSKVKKAHASHEKNSKRNGRVAIESHDKYIQTVQALTHEITRAKTNYCTLIGNKTYITSLVIASTLGGVADSEFKAKCENVRRSGVHIGKLNEWLNFASSEAMTAIQPVDLDDEALGWAQRLAMKEAEMYKEIQKVEEARLASLEHAQTIWKAQQMGWLPPDQVFSKANVRRNPLPMVPSNAVNNLPRLQKDTQEVHTNDPLEPDTTASVTNLERTKEKPREEAEIIKESKKNVEGDVSVAQRLHGMTFAEGTSTERGTKSDGSEDLCMSNSGSGSSPSKSSNSYVDEHQSSGMTSFSRISEDDLAVADFEAKSRGPTTPVDEIAMQSVTIYNTSPEKGILKRPEFAEEVKNVEVVSAEKSLDRYADQGIQERNLTLEGSVERSESIAKRAHHIGIREREKEQERNIERESELHRRLLQAEDRLRQMETKAQYSSVPVESPMRRPRYSEPTQSYRREHFDQEIPTQRYEPDQDTPATAVIKTNSKITRNFSTDSERSFVARMRARYQEEKEERKMTSPIRSADVYIDTQRTKPMYTYEPITTSQRAVQEPRSIQDIKGQQREVHRADCSCWNCSARNYNPTSKSDSQQGYIQAPLSDRPHSNASSAPPPTYRRQSMPPVKKDSDSLKTPQASSKELHVRRSFEDDDHINQEKKVMFATNSYR